MNFMMQMRELLLGNTNFNFRTGGCQITKRLNTSLFQHVRTHGSFTSVSTRAERPLELNVNQEGNNLQIVERTLGVSIRRISDRTGVPHMRV